MANPKRDEVPEVPAGSPAPSLPLGSAEMFPSLRTASSRPEVGWSLPVSYAYCRRLCHQARSSFPLTFWILPPHQRRGMQALYAFLRLSDDLVDDSGSVDQGIDRQTMNLSRTGPAGADLGVPRLVGLTLAHWRRALEMAFQGQPTHPVHPALVDTVRRFGIQPYWLQAVLDGLAQDAGPVRLATFAELYTYCWRVASAVGLACLAIWGLRPGVAWSEAEPAATAAGIAFQLTNILRDLGEDLRKDRVYLPQEELQAFGCPVERWSDAAYRPALARMIRWQVERTWSYFRRAAPLTALLPPRPRTVFCLMTNLYQYLLQQVEKAGPEILSQRVRLRAWWRWSLFLQAYTASWTCHPYPTSWAGYRTTSLA